MHDDQSVFIQPVAGPQQQALAIGGVRHLVAQYTHERTALVFAHPGKAQNLASLLLVVEQGAAPGVKRAQRGQIRCLDLQQFAQVAQQGHWHGTNTVQWAPAHA